MTYRIHTSETSSISVRYVTPETVDETVGQYHYGAAETDRRLTLVDGGNEEALVLVGTADEVRDLARRILAEIGETGTNTNDIDRAERAAYRRGVADAIAALELTGADLLADAIAEATDAGPLPSEEV